MNSSAMPPSSIQAAARMLRRLDGDARPTLAIVGGSGLGALREVGEVSASLSFAEIPGLGAAGVAGHENRWLLAHAQGRAFYCLLGRRHLYEGIEPATAGLAMRILAELGVRTVLLTNAAGGLVPRLAPGDLMLVRDHLNLMLRDPARGAVEKDAPSAHGLPAPGGYCYDADSIGRLRQCALEERIELKEGIYAGLCGPCYETRAEVAMLRRLGADAAGMSTVPEALTAARAGLRVAAVSLITNSHCGGGAPASHEEVLRAAAASGRRLASLVRRLILSPAHECQ